MGAPNNCFWVNMDAWNSLTDDLRGILELAGHLEGGFGYAANNLLADKEAEAEVIAKGGFKHVIPDDEYLKMAALVKPLWAEAAGDDPDGLRALKLINLYMTRLGR